MNQNKLMQLATQANGKLWVCNVYFATDSEAIIYWTSARDRRHSKEIEHCSDVAATIVHSAERKQAIQISGVAERIPVKLSQPADDIYSKKFGHKDSRMQEVLQDTPQSRAYWILKPSLIELWDEVNFPDSPKQQVNLN